MPYKNDQILLLSFFDFFFSSHCCEPLHKTTSGILILSFKMSDNKPQPEDFDNPDVLNAVNPHPEWGYMHGKLVSLRFNVH